MSGKSSVDRSYSHSFAPEIEPLARVMFGEMQYLWCGGRAWDELAESERAYFRFVVERLLVERDTILKFFANNSDRRWR